MHGLGKFHFEDGKLYEGSFIEGRIEGFGIIRHPD
jgi:hypothetical protein